MKTFIAALGLTLALAIFIGGGVVLFSALKKSPNSGSSLTNVYNSVPTASQVWIGKDVDTLLIATSTGRRYLKITNLSGATSTSQALYCNVNDKASALYTGFVVFGSSSVEFNLDNMYTGALRCKFQSATSSVAIIEV